VGLTFLVVGAVLFFSLSWLRGRLSAGRYATYYVTFDDAKGLAPGGDVQIAGVSVGRVDDVGLEGNHAKVRVQIKDGLKLPEGTRFLIQTRLLGGTPTLSVDPPDTPPAGAGIILPGSTVAGSGTPGLLSQALDPQQQEQVDQLLSTTTKITENLNQLVTTLNDPAIRRELKNSDETLRNIRAITRNAAEASNTLPRLSAQAESQLSTLSIQANQVLANLQAASATAPRLAASGERLAKNAEGLTTDLRATLNENRPALKTLVQSADEAVSAVAGLTDQLTSTLGDPKLKGNLQTVTDNLASASQRLDAVAANLQQFSSDPRLASDLRETLSNVRETSASVRNLAARVEGLRLPGEKRRPTTPDGTPEPPARPAPLSTSLLLQRGLAVDSLYDTKDERLGVTADFTHVSGGGKGRFYRAGLADIGETNRLDLQLGQWNGSDLAYRYGLLNGKLGLGLDAHTGPLYWRFDVFDPNRLQFNARARAYLNEGSAITFGVDSIGKDDRAVLGVQIRN
jgi:phospholipid/cholesterol/gamma-HCH transport system substrate-binding protein